MTIPPCHGGVEVSEIGVAFLGIHLVLCFLPLLLLLLLLSFILISLRLLLVFLTLKLLPRQYHLLNDHTITISIFLVRDDGSGYRGKSEEDLFGLRLLNGATLSVKFSYMGEGSNIE